VLVVGLVVVMLASEGGLERLEVWLGVAVDVHAADGRNRALDVAHE
jgi:hypothetical protein